jgi:ABC-type branched-subunit amino acid transport system substrate-binding protein
MQSPILTQPSRTLPRAGLSRLALAAALVSVAGCSVVVDTSRREPCTTHAECTERHGEPTACVEASCIKLLNQDCTEVLPAGILERENVILFGYLGDIASGANAYGTPTKEGAELAFNEIESLDGIPGASRQGRRHVGMLVCDHGADPVAVARHLVENAKVPAIIGASFSGVTLRSFHDVGLPSQTLFISPSATSPDLTTDIDEGLLWRTAPSDVVQTEALKFLAVHVGKALQPSDEPEANEKPKIAVLYKDDSAGEGLFHGITTTGTAPNAAPAVQSELTKRYSDPADGEVDWEQYVTWVLKEEPDIVIPLGTTEFVEFMMPEIERNWNPAEARPWYLLPEGSRAEQLVALAKGNDEWALGRRVIGTAPGARQSALYDQFRLSFRSTFDQREPGNLAEFGYDAAYLLIYAIAISGQAFPTGRKLADALTHVTCDENPVPAGRNQFSGYFSTAALTQCINFEGASGPLDFDNASGEAISDIAMWCLREGPDGVSLNPPIDSYYSAEQGGIAWGTEQNTPIEFNRPDWCPPAP